MLDRYGKYRAAWSRAGSSAPRFPQTRSPSASTFLRRNFTCVPLLDAAKLFWFTPILQRTSLSGPAELSPHLPHPPTRKRHWGWYRFCGTSPNGVGSCNDTIGGAKGNRTPDLLDANETRYQLRYSPAGSFPARDGEL